jgi:hypothetical protein
MNFDFKAVATTFPAIALIISFACFFLGYEGLGFLFLLVAVGSFVLMIFGRKSR